MKTIINIIFILASISILAQESPKIIYGNYANQNTLYQNVLNKYDATILQNPQDVQTLLKRSELHALLGNDVAANQDINRAISINPYAKIYYNPAYRKHQFVIKDFTYLDKDLDQEVNKFYESFLLYEEYLNYINGDTMSIDYLNHMSNVISALINRDYDDAQLYFDKIPDSLAHSALYFDLEGVLLMKQKNLEGAIESFSRSILINPKFIVPYHNRAIAYKKLGNFKAAEQDFNMALRLNTEIAKIHFAKAKLEQLQGNLEDAKQSYESAANAEEYTPIVKANYSALLKATGDYSGAMANINQVINDDPEIIENYYIRAGIYFIYGEYINAITDFQEYLISYPNDSEAWFYKGLSKVLNGDVYQGCQDLNKSLDLGYDRENKEIIYFMCTNKSHK